MRSRLRKRANWIEARKWLDWVREDLKIASEDDALGGPVFPRVWTRGQTATAEQIRFAAALLLNNGDEALPALQAAMASANSPITKSYFQLATAQLCVREEKWADGLDSAKALYAAYPNSQVAITTLENILSGLKRFDEAEKVLRTAMANNSDDLNAKRLLVFELAEAHRMQQAATVAKEIAESPDATGMDWNQYGWITLFVGQVDEQKIHAVERAWPQPNPAVEQTIASMYAEIGRLNEARQLSLQSLDQFGLRTPDSSWWYVFARIAEQLNVPAAAKSYYAKVENDADGQDATSVYKLAQTRVAAMR